MNAPDSFQSSDSIRHGRPLAYAQQVTFDEPDGSWSWAGDFRK